MNVTWLFVSTLGLWTVEQMILNFYFVVGSNCTLCFLFPQINRQGYVLVPNTVVKADKGVPVIESDFFACEKLVAEQFRLLLEHLDKPSDTLVGFPIDVDVDAVIGEGEEVFVDNASWGDVDNWVGEEEFAFVVFEVDASFVVEKHVLKSGEFHCCPFLLVVTVQ